MNEKEASLKAIVEALLIASEQPLSIPQIVGVFEKEQAPATAGIRAAITALQDDCSARGVELIQVTSGYRYRVKPMYSGWVQKLSHERPARYSRALLETLALIAYRQPVTRGEIEDIRGVAVSSNIVKMLEERQWVQIVGHRDTPGKPALYATTRQFLDYFNLKALSDLPSLAEIENLDDKVEHFEQQLQLVKAQD